MTRIAKPEHKTPLELHGMTRADLKKAVAAGQVPRAQRALVDLFLKFTETRPDSMVLSPELAVALARAHLAAKYDLANNTLSRAEQQLMGVVGKRASDLAKALKAAAADPAI
jgi:hypothetical protein